MPRSRAYAAGLALVIAGGTLQATACGDAPVGPDALRPETFQLALMNGQSLPAMAYTLSFGGSVWLTSARLKSIVAGRTIDPRIFEDRSGGGTSGGSSRDSTTASAEMADIREFEERGGPTIGHHTDTSTVTVERRGDLLILTRPGPIDRLSVVDTAHFVDGQLVVLVREWERFGTKANNVEFVYSISK